MKLRIKSDGTKVFGVDEDGTDTEHEISGITGACWSVNVRTGRAHVTLEVTMVEVEVEVDGEMAEFSPYLGTRVGPTGAATVERLIDSIKPDADFIAG